MTRDDIKFENGEIQIDFDFAGKMLHRLAKIVLKKGLPEGIDLLNVNVPENPMNEDFEVVSLGDRMYSPVVHERLDPRGKPYYWIDGEPYELNKPGSDGYELREKQKTTITPIKIDQTSNMSSLKGWFE